MARSNITEINSEALNTKRNFSHPEFNLKNPALQLYNTNFTIRGEKLKLEIANHDHSFCLSALEVIEENGFEKGLILGDTLPYILQYGGNPLFSCVDLYRPFDCENGLAKVSHYKLDLDIPSKSPSVYNLAKNIAIISNNVILNKPQKIEFFNGRYSYLHHLETDLIVNYADIKGELTDAEKALFFECVKLNPTFFRTIQLDLNTKTILDSSEIMSHLIGYMVPNFINLLEVYSYPKYNL